MLFFMFIWYLFLCVLFLNLEGFIIKGWCVFNWDVIVIYFNFVIFFFYGGKKFDIEDDNYEFVRFSSYFVKGF